MIRILVAEDNAVNRELLRELLEARGYTVSEACDGQQALRIIEQTHPDIVLLDISMPVLDGYAVARKIRENPAFAPLSILAITAYAMQGDREKILNSGFDGYLSKPVNASALTDELERLLRKQEDRNTPPHQSPEGQANGKPRAAGEKERYESMEKSNGGLPPQFVHDLVNELAVISSHCDLLKRHVGTGSQSSKRVDVIKAVAHHVARELHEHQCQLTAETSRRLDQVPYRDAETDSSSKEPKCTKL